MRPKISLKKKPVFVVNRRVYRDEPSRQDAYQFADFFRFDQTDDQVAAVAAEQTLVEVALLGVRARCEQIRRQRARVRVAVVVERADEAHADQIRDVAFGQADGYVAVGGC